MKKRMLSLLLAALAVLSLGVPALGDAPEDTPAPTLAPKDTPTETVVPTTEPTEAPMETATPTLEPTEVPMGTVVHTSEATVPPEETISPTLEPIIALEETITPTLEPTEMPEEMADPTEGPEESPEPDGEIMLLAEEGGKYVLDKTEVTMYSTLRPITLTVYMQPYESNNRNKWKVTSSAPDVVKVEQVEGKGMNGVDRSAQIKLWALKPGDATITVAPTDDWIESIVPKYESVTCAVHVVQDGSTTWGMTMSDIEAMSDPATQLSIYDPRDLGIMTDVNLQVGGICGMEGNIAAMEASILREGFLTKEQADLAERHLVYHLFNHTADPVGYSAPDVTTNLNWQNEAIRIHAAGTFMTHWNGPIHDKTNDPTLYSADGYSNCVAVPEDVVFVTGEVDELKRVIVQYGGIAFGYQSPLEGVLYHYQSSKGNGWHCSAIVGWDDTVDRNLFQIPARQDGAWIVKNSWGVDKHGDGHGYFYLSYDATRENPIAYKMMPRSTYDFNYFYDGTVKNVEGYQSQALNDDGAAVSFQARMAETGQDEYLEAVNVGVSYGSDVTVEVYTGVPEDKVKGDELDPTWGYKQPAATGHRSGLSHAGLYTIKLGHPIKLEQGQYFTVVVKIPGGSVMYAEEPIRQSTNDLTFVTVDGVWRNTHTLTPWDVMTVPTLRIKAFTSVYSDEEAPAPPDATPIPSPSPTPVPTAEPTPEPTAEPTTEPTVEPTTEPTAVPTTEPTTEPTTVPTAVPTAEPTTEPTATPETTPTATPEASPTASPETTPTATPEASPTATPETTPTATPEAPPTASPETTPTLAPVTTASPAVTPTSMPAAPHTGDGTPLGLYGLMLAVSLVGLLLVLRKKRI